ncbi:uncharacterized protein LOC133791219 [Humulus lupulus]|uniref:uncharacterized protein LOC133791219 n=1 Tax=Humulus lupulus TaxID=3486 RepID=UPI002B4096F0|nr:uncharacterized protein LOC133791219 [Humulus lupulus]
MGEIDMKEYCTYRNPKEPLEARLKDLLSRMTLEEKVGQITQIERRIATANKDIITKFYIGGMLSATGSGPFPDALCSEWADMVNGFQKLAMGTRLGIPLLYGIDAIHGIASIKGATIFPHNIGLGATRDADLVRRIGAATALEVKTSGINCNFAPCVAVCKDPRWGRCYESFSEDTEVVRNMTSIVTGLQGEPPTGHQRGHPFVAGRHNVAACAKHFVGDGGTEGGKNEGNTLLPYNELEKIHMAPFLDCINKGVSMIMPSYSSWNGDKLHANRFLLTDVLKDKLGFKGIVISDWRGIDRLSEPCGSNYRACILSAMESGIDMVMVPYRYDEFFDHLVSLVKSEELPMARIDDAVERILRVKFVAGLFEHPYTEKSWIDSFGCEKHRNLAREAVRKSLVLLKNGKNKPHLPLESKPKKILVAGTHAHNLGFQCGGWTGKWQGLNDENERFPVGTTILEGIIETTGKDTETIYEKEPSEHTLKRDDISLAIVAVGEVPYAESFGDNEKLELPSEITGMVISVAEKFPTLMILISGRALALSPELLDKIEVLIAAWLPGTEGGGIADLVFGDYEFQGRLPITWFRSVDQLSNRTEHMLTDPLFRFGDGLTKYT